MENNEMDFDLLSIDPSMGESRGAQIFGLILLVATIVGAIYFAP